MRKIVLDIETYDPELKEKGPGAFRDRENCYPFMLGVFLPDTNQEWHVPWEQAASLLRPLLAEPFLMIGCNLKYDLLWLLRDKILTEEHVVRTNRFADCLIRAALICETKHPGHYSMDGQAMHYGLMHKPIELLLLTAANQGIVANEKTIWRHLKDLPFETVAEYLSHDLRTTAAIFELQEPQLVEGKLETVSRLEEELLPVLALMEARGVLVDTKAAEELYEATYAHVSSLKESLRQQNEGVDVNVNTSNSLIKFLQDRGHVLPETPASTPEKRRYSTSEDTLKRIAATDPAAQEVLICRKALKIADGFVRDAILGNHVDGRIHCSWNQTRASVGEDSEAEEAQGARYGRMSCAKPNLQQVPKRDKIGFDDTGGLGTAMRRLFIAEPGFQMMSADFSAQEPRWIVHFAETWGIEGAKKVGDQYRKDPTVSSHDIVAAGIIAPGKSPKEIRNMAKEINLGKGYEMGRAKLITRLTHYGLDVSQADTILQQYDENFPHVSGSSKRAANTADYLGYVRTYSGRRLNFDLWEPKKFGHGESPLPYAQAVAKWRKNGTPITRSSVYRAFNRIIQGSSGDQTKMAVNSLWYDYNILVTAIIHDEILDARSTPERAKIIKHVMENVVQLTIPCLTEVKVGPNWAEGKKIT